MKIKAHLGSWLVLVVLALTTIAMFFVIVSILDKLSSTSGGKSKDRFSYAEQAHICKNCWENFSSYMDHPSKCYSCERDMIQRQGEEWAWIGQKTKSFDAERAMIDRTGQHGAAYEAHPIRYY